MYGANRTGLKFNLVFDFYVLINTSEIEHKDFKDGWDFFLNIRWVLFSLCLSTSEILPPKYHPQALQGSSI